jgi:hypothetical protein
MDILVFAAGVFLFARKHRFLGGIMVIVGAIYILLSALEGLRYAASI